MARNKNEIPHVYSLKMKEKFNFEMVSDAQNIPRR